VAIYSDRWVVNKILQADFFNGLGRFWDTDL